MKRPWLFLITGLVSYGACKQIVRRAAGVDDPSSDLLQGTSQHHLQEPSETLPEEPSVAPAGEPSEKPSEGPSLKPTKDTAAARALRLAFKGQPDPYLRAVWKDYRAVNFGNQDLDGLINTWTIGDHGSNSLPPSFRRATGGRNVPAERSLAKQLLQRIVRWAPSSLLQSLQRGPKGGLTRDLLLETALMEAKSQCDRQWKELIQQASENKLPQALSRLGRLPAGPRHPDRAFPLATLRLHQNVTPTTLFLLEHMDLPQQSPKGYDGEGSMTPFSHFVDHHHLTCADERFLAPFLTVSPTYSPKVFAPLLAMSGHAQGVQSGPLPSQSRHFISRLFSSNKS